MLLRPIRVLIADGNKLSALGLEVVLREDTDLDIMGQVSNASALLEALSNLSVQVVLLDFTSPGFSLETIPMILERDSSLRIVAITPDQEGHTILNALKAGVYGYVKKDCDFAEIVSSVHQTYQGTKFFCGQILETIERVEIDPEDFSNSQNTCAPVQLSEREQEIITLIAEGLTNTAIADRLFLSPHTINTHRKNIMQKLHVNNTASIVMYAVKANLVNVNKFLFSAR